MQTVSNVGWSSSCPVRKRQFRQNLFRMRLWCTRHSKRSLLWKQIHCTQLYRQYSLQTHLTYGPGACYLILLEQNKFTRLECHACKGFWVGYLHVQATVLLSSFCKSTIKSTHPWWRACFVLQTVRCGEESGWTILRFQSPNR